MKDTKHLFIVNPKAGKGAALKAEKRIAELFWALEKKYPGITFEIHRTSYPGHATEIAREYSRQGVYRIYAVGGDGTLNEVLNGMAGSDSSLAIIPCGTGNDFIKSIAGRFDPEEILKDTILGRETLVDLCKINDKYFINIVSVGLDAIINQAASGYKTLPLVTANMAYFAGIIKCLKGKKPTTLSFTIDDREYEQEILLMAICNGQYYGGSFHMAPTADLSDGLLDVVIVDDIPIGKLLRYLPRLMKGTHLNIPELTYVRAKHIMIKAPAPMIINLDGESDSGSVCDISIEQAKLKLILPRGF